MSDSILVRVTVESYDVAHPSVKQTQVYVQIPEVARATWLLPEDHFLFSKNDPWPSVVDSAQEHYAQCGSVSDSAAAAARAAVVEWLQDDANHDAMYEAWEQDQARQHPVARKWLGQVAELKRQLDQAHDDLTGSNLSLFEEERESARLRLALESARRGRREARARVAELEHKKELEDRERVELLTGLERALAPFCVDAKAAATAAAEVRHCEAEWLLRDAQQSQDQVTELEARLAEHERPADTYPPAMPWAALMDHDDLTEFLDELAASAITHASSEVALAEVESTCGRWRAIAEAQHAHNTAPGPDAGLDGIVRRIAPTQALREDEPAEEPQASTVDADRAKAPWGRGEDGRPLLPMGAHWTDIPELVDRNLAGIQARVDQAQPGNWYVSPAAEAPDTVCTQYDGYTRTVGRLTNMLPGDRDLVLHAHSDLRWCLDMIAKLRARVAELEAAQGTVYRAGHPDSGITLGHYSTEAAARQHCETTERRSWPTGTTLAFDWIEDDEDRVAELVVTAEQNEESTTGYIVTALELASEYDEEADE